MDTCTRCGAGRGSDDPGSLLWSTGRDPDGRPGLLCPDCTRRHVRDIEARLPSGWWE